MSKQTKKSSKELDKSRKQSLLWNYGWPNKQLHANVRTISVKKDFSKISLPCNCCWNERSHESRAFSVKKCRIPWKLRWSCPIRDRSQEITNKIQQHYRLKKEWFWINQKRWPWVVYHSKSSFIGHKWWY